MKYKKPLLPSAAGCTNIGGVSKRVPFFLLQLENAGNNTKRREKGQIERSRQAVNTRRAWRLLRIVTAACRAAYNEHSEEDKFRSFF